MEIEKLNAIAAKPEEIYQLGNIISSEEGYFYVIQLYNGNYALLNLETNSVVNSNYVEKSEFKTSEELARAYYTTCDRVIKAKLVIEENFKEVK
ncbi:hypothetical protein [Ligilactobacillus equi]|uniref:Uncharacterized protein n=1 Tax=Ligilactobacillus equi DPC 6820 TaxID=1392007 RepID=V7HW81_9LACO|nr:hypothetical protein [Ligilactobacillus equi]ETA74499.1 hypothetical protein LEQ_0364 [Ligilactobacillus equi DPC 6820]